MKVNEDGKIMVEGSHGSVEIDPKNYPSLNFYTSQSDHKEVKAKGELIKCYQITPSGDRQHDSVIVEAGETWEPALAYAERVLDSQFSELEESGKQWEDISVEIRCIRMPALELDELTEP